MPLRQTPKGLFLHLRVSPKSGRNHVAGVVSNAAGQRALAVKVTAAPDKGAANKAVIEALAEAFGVARSSFRLVAGETSRDKVVQVMQHQDAVSASMEEFRP